MQTYTEKDATLPSNLAKNPLLGSSTLRTKIALRLFEIVLEMSEIEVNSVIIEYAELEETHQAH